MSTSTHRDGLPISAAEASLRPRAGAEILPFAPRRRPRAAGEEGEALGRILLFTGVRYERWAEPDPAPTVEPAAQRRRS